MFTFCHLVISGVSCYSCLCIEIVPLVILLPSISRPGRLALSSEFQSGQSSLCRQALLFQGRCTVIWHLDLLLAEDEGPPKTGSFCEAVLIWPVTEAVVSVVHTLTCVDYFLRSPETKMAPAVPEAEASQAGWTPVPWPGRWPDVWSSNMALPQKLCGSCLSQKLLASVVHTLTCRLPAAESRNKGGSCGS